MQTNKISLWFLGLLVLSLVAVGFFVVKPVLAQVEATSSEAVAPSTETVAEVAPVEEAPVSTTEAPIESSSSNTDTSVSESSGSEAAATESSSGGEMVEVQLDCSKSYTGILYDTPSGHLDEGFFLGTESASTTGMTAAHELGMQSWTVCHDAEGNEYEFTLTPEEYAALAIRGTPQRSVMKAAGEAAPQSSTPDSSPTASDASISSEPTASPEVLGASTSSDASTTTEESAEESQPVPATETPASTSDDAQSQSTETTSDSTASTTEPNQ
jgi:hypothetical protein